MNRRTDITEAGQRILAGVGPDAVNVQAVFIVRDQTGAELWHLETVRANIDRKGTYTATYTYDSGIDP